MTANGTGIADLVAHDLAGPGTLDAAEEGRSRSTGRAVVRMLIVVILTVGTRVWCRLRGVRGAGRRAEALRAMQRLARTLIRTLRVETSVAGHPPEGLCVLVANHRSYIDVPILLAHAPSVFLAKAEVGSWPVFGPATKIAGTVFVERDNRESRRVAFEMLRAELERGGRVIVFPEGTTSREPGCRPFRLGAFRLAVELGLPVAPVAIAYADARDSWVDDEPFIGHFLDRFAERRSRVRLSFGPALRGTHAGELLRAASGWIENELERAGKA